MKFKLKISTGEIITGFPTRVECLWNHLMISNPCTCGRHILGAYTIFKSYSTGYIIRFEANGKWYYHYSLEPINTPQRLIEKCLWQSID